MRGPSEKWALLLPVGAIVGLTVFFRRADNAIAADDFENRSIDADSR